MLIRGQPVTTSESIEVINPRTGEVLGLASDVEAENLWTSLEAAEEGFSVWSAKKPSERKEIVLCYADLLDKHSKRIVELLMAETGKPLDNATYDFGMLTACLRFFVEEYERLDQPVLHDPNGRFLHYIQRQPLGVAVGMLAWNFPLLNIGYKLGPVLASGCSTIIKPSSLTPLASLEAAYLTKEAGIPDGVVNVITSSGHEIIRTLLESNIPSMVTMIGSTRGGREVMRSSCTSIKYFSVELGGNAPVLVYPDADVKRAAEQITGLKFANCGQICVAPNRVFVHEAVCEEFVRCCTEAVSGIEMGPLISENARKHVLGLVESARADGAEVVLGGHAVKGGGFFMEPTILRNVSVTMEVAEKEVFGPVMSIIPFSDSDDEIALANDTEYGLAAYVFTSDLSTGLRAARDIQAGSVCVNEPYYSVSLPHGGLKQSGIGKDCSRYSLEEYLTLKRVSILIGD